MVVVVVLTQNDDPSWSVPSCLGQLPCGPPCHHLSSVVNVPGSKGLELQLTKTTWPLCRVNQHISVGQEVKNKFLFWEDLRVSVIDMLSKAVHNLKSRSVAMLFHFAKPKIWRVPYQQICWCWCWGTDVNADVDVDQCPIPVDLRGHWQGHGALCTWRWTYLANNHSLDCWQVDPIKYCPTMIDYHYVTIFSHFHELHAWGVRCLSQNISRATKVSRLMLRTCVPPSSPPPNRAAA